MRQRPRSRRGDVTLPLGTFGTEDPRARWPHSLGRLIPNPHVDSGVPGVPYELAKFPPTHLRPSRRRLLTFTSGVRKEVVTVHSGFGS